MLRGIEYKLLNQLRLKGLEGVKKVFIRKDKRRVVQADGSIKGNEEWMLETDGSNLKDMLQN